MICNCGHHIQYHVPCGCTAYGCKCKNFIPRQNDLRSCPKCSCVYAVAHIKEHVMSCEGNRV